MRSLISLSLLLTILDLSINYVNAAIFPLHARSGPPLRPRGSASTVQNITSLGNVQYVTNITVAGVELSVSLDTGRFVKFILMSQRLIIFISSIVLIYGQTFLELCLQRA